MSADDNPYAAPEQDQVWKGRQEQFVIYRGDDCLYLEDKVELPPRCIYCAQATTSLHRFDQRSLFGFVVFSVKYYLCGFHLLACVGRNLLQFFAGISFIITFMMMIVFYGDITISLIFLATLATLLFCNYYTIKARRDRGQDPSLYRVTGFGEAFLSQFTYRKPD